MPNGRCSCGQYAPCNGAYCDYNMSAWAIEYKPLESYNIFPSYSPPKNTDTWENDNTLQDVLATRRAAEEAAAAEAENQRKLRASMLTTIELKQKLGQVLTEEEKNLLNRIESERVAQYADIDISPKVFLYGFLGFMGLMGIAGMSNYKKDGQEIKSAPVVALTRMKANIFGQNKVQIGVLNEDSCVVARPPFQYDSKGFLLVEVNTSQGIVYGNVDKSLLYKGASTVENCKAEIRQVFNDPTKPETKNLPIAGTFTVPSRIPLYFGTTTPPSGLFAEAGSCIRTISSGHSDNMLYVTVSDTTRMGDMYVFKNAVRPLGNYDLYRGCDAIITGTVINHRPKAPVKQEAVQETKPAGKTSPTPVSKPLEIHNGNLYIVTADRLELRSGPGAAFGALNTIFKDSCVQALGGRDNINGFVKVLTSYDQRHYQRGFVSQVSLKPARQGLSKMECFIK